MLFAWVKRPRTLLIWAITIFSLSVLGLAAFTGVITLSAAVPEARGTIEAGLAQGQIDAQAEADRAVAIYRSGDVAAIIEQRLRELGQMSAYAALAVPSILTMFLLGAYLGRRGVFRDLEAHRPLFRRMLLWGLIVGVPTNALYATWAWTTPLEAGDLTVQMGASLMGAIGQPALCLAYIGGLSLLAGDPRWGRWLGALAPVGRMALTNYLLQSVLATMIFYGYGLGLYGQVGTVAGLGIAVAIYALLIPLSHLWLSRFRYGPAEWLWRTLTYLRPQPMRYAGRAADPGDRLEHGSAG